VDHRPLTKDLHGTATGNEWLYDGPTEGGWEAIVRETQLTWDALKQINSTQLATSFIKELAVVVVTVAGAVVPFALAEALVAVLLALAAMIATASATTLAALAAALGVSATVSLATAS
jgi:hypothetical protein